MWSLFLINFQTFRPATLLKRDSNTGSFLWNLWKFFRTSFNIFFYRTHPVAASDIILKLKTILKHSCTFFFRRITLHLFLQTIHFWPLPQKLFKLFYKITPKQLFSSCLVGVNKLLLFKYSNILNVTIVYYRRT